jgi:hypothetical protein
MGTEPLTLTEPLNDYIIGVIRKYLILNPDKPELNIEDLLYRCALSFQFKSIAFLSEP